MEHSWLDFLTSADLPVPQDRPFGFLEAVRALGGPRQVRGVVRRGLLLSPLRGVYVVPTLPDGLALRLDCLRLVVPADAVVCDRTAGWVHGAPRILAPGSHLAVPPADLYLPRGRRLRNRLVESGARGFRPTDLMEIGGLRVTTPLRTAADLGRLLHRDQALAALDSLARLGAFTPAELVAEAARFKGFRGVRQLRELVPLADGRSESPGESILRLRWLDCPDLPRPVPQWAVAGRGGARFLDLAAPEIGYAAEYDGEEFHGPERRAHDRRRRAELEAQGWVVDVFRAVDIHGPHQDAETRLRAGVRAALGRRRTLG